MSENLVDNIRKYRVEWNRKLDALDKATRKKVTGKGTSEPGCPPES